MAAKHNQIDDGAGCCSISVQSIHRGRARATLCRRVPIFGHGNVTCLAEALEAVQDQLPTWRGQNEQSMALAAIMPRLNGGGN